MNGEFMTKKRISRLRAADADMRDADSVADTPHTRSQSYRLAFSDKDFLCRDETRAVRMQLELQKPELALAERGIESTTVIFGGARIREPARKSEARTKRLAELSRHYDEAREFARLMTLKSVASGGRDWVVTTGGGPGIMEAGNLGAADAGGISIGLSVVLPDEATPNEHITEGLCFNFHYFAIRKVHFLMRAKVVVCFAGGFGTLDEVFETLTLLKNERMERIPFILFDREFWTDIVNWDGLVDAGTVPANALDLISFADTAAQAVEIVEAHYAGEAP